MACSRQLSFRNVTILTAAELRQQRVPSSRAVQQHNCHRIQEAQAEGADSESWGDRACQLHLPLKPVPGALSRLAANRVAACLAPAEEGARQLLTHLFFGDSFQRPVDQGWIT